MNSSRNRMSYLLRRMITSSVRNVIMIFGVLIAISQLGISLAPLLAGLGIAGFIVGFALQDSLSNFASGVMILMYRPFDVGDVDDAAGVRVRVHVPPRALRSCTRNDRRCRLADTRLCSSWCRLRRAVRTGR